MCVCVSGRVETKRDWGYIYQGTLRKEMDYSMKDSGFGVHKKLSFNQTTSLSKEYFFWYITTLIQCQLLRFPQCCK